METNLYEWQKSLQLMTQQIQQLKQLKPNLSFERELRLLNQWFYYGLNYEQKLQLARHPKRPTSLDYIQSMSDEWLEFHGDRKGSDDQALITGIAQIEDETIIWLAHQKGRDTKENLQRNFGMPSPGGYRKALRMMQHANKFNLPIVTLIDTPGAWAGIDAEKEGQAQAIAACLQTMFSLEVPMISVVIGEGGSGGALAIGVSNWILMLEHAVYTVATPEACAAILWKDASKSAEAAEALKIGAEDLLALGIIDEMIPEPVGCAHQDPASTIKKVKQKIYQRLRQLKTMSGKQLRIHRAERFRHLGYYVE
nr:acetyl-CoA carboxylase carboxyltransferase alpha subunit [Cyanidioschyzonaceae sp. 1]